jgi:ribosomal-protein-alanine acetyltransferase
MNGGVSFRLAPMQESDIDDVFALEESVAVVPWTRGHYADSIKAGYSGWIARDAKGRLLGYYLLMRAVDDVHLLNIGVDPSVQRRGLGARLLEDAFERARLAGGTGMFLEVRPSNRPAIALYERYGFIEVGRRRAYYPAPAGREDAIVMRRDLAGQENGKDALDSSTVPDARGETCR